MGTKAMTGYIPRLRLTVLGASVLVNLLALAVPLAMLQLFQRIIPNQSFASLQVLFVILCGVVVLDVCLKIARRALMSAAAQDAQRKVSHDVVHRLFHGRFAELDMIGSERLASRILRLPQLSTLLSMQRQVQRVDLLFSALFLLLIAVLAGPLVLVPVCMIAAGCLIARRIRSDHLEALETVEQNDLQRMSLLIESLSNIRLLKVFGAEQRILQRYDSLHRRSDAANETLVRHADIAFTTSALMGQATTGVTSLIGAWLVIDNRIGLAELATSILLTGRSVAPFITWAFAFPPLEDAARSAEGIEEVLGVSEAPTGPRRSGPSSCAMEGRALSVRCPTGATIDLGTFTIPKNEITCVYGQRGAAAHGVMCMLAGEVAPSKGSLALGKSLDAKRRLMAFVPADQTFLQGTFLENLGDFRNRSKVSNRVALLRKFGFFNGLSSVDGGIEQQFLSTDRSPGSPGYYKTLTLAAALSRGAQIVILEDPFAHLDPKSTSQLEKVLIDLSKDTTIVVSEPTPAIRKVSKTHLTLRSDAIKREARARRPTNERAPDMPIMVGVK